MLAIRRLSVAITACLSAAALTASAFGPTSAAARATPAANTAPAAGTAASTGRAPSASTAAFPTKPIHWGRCATKSLRAAKARCGFLTVPMDYANPTGPTLKLAMSRVKATAPASKRQGVLISNPGGPGGPGLGLAGFLAGALPKAVASTYDMIGFDPRGVGDSKPAVSCIADYAKGPRPAYEPTLGPLPLRSPNERAWLQRSEDYATACGAKYPHLLAHLGTVDEVKDIEVMRRTLGVRKINYYGFSYGTYLGEVYSTLYPKHTRRMVWDGVVDPRDIWYGAQLSQDRAFEVSIGEFWKWVAAHDDVYHLGSSAPAVEKRFYTDQAKLASKPNGPLGSAEWNDVFVNAGYYQSTWPDVAGAFAAYAKGDAGPMKAMYADSLEPDDNGYAMYTAVQCVDAPWPRDYEQWRSDAFATAAQAPFITWNNTWYNTPCLYWPAPSGTPVNVDGSRTPQVLLINATKDAATPYPGSLEIRRRYPHSVLISEEGSTTHADSLDGNACMDNKIYRYLRDGHLPKRRSGTGSDVKCKRSPLPEPST
jgi:pimeloyl-ACP methyl ester carboxylesterase